MNFLQVSELTKDYDSGLVHALRGTSMTVDAGELVALVGPSGCGKSTLLSLIGLLDRPTGGRILFEETDVASLAPWHRFRAHTVGFVFQFHHLVANMTLCENVEAPLVALHVPRAERRRRALRLLEQVGLAQRADFFPSRISGGERQRAAVARAIVHQPRLLLADEPTGNLDSATGESLVEFLWAEVRSRGTTVLLATHSHELAARCDRRIAMRDGRVVTECSA